MILVQAITLSETINLSNVSDLSTDVSVDVTGESEVDAAVSLNKTLQEGTVQVRYIHLFMPVG